MADNAEAAVEIRRMDIRSREAQTLILELNAELKARYPEEGACHFRLEADEVTEGRGAFLVGFAAGEKPVACGAVRRIDPETCEIKRMYVKPPWRGKGIARAMVAALEQESRRLGVGRIVLETGVRQHEALSLYSKAGFERIAAFGDYAGKPLSVCFAKTLPRGLGSVS
jgi:GNAT superfamily N-acetyltransferase